MKLIKKSDFENIVGAVSAVSGYNTQTLLESRLHMHTSWVHLGIYAAKDMGASLVEAGNAFKRHITTGHASVCRVSIEVRNDNAEVIGLIKEIQQEIRNRRSEKKIDCAPA
jgi:hypothetical protein